MRYGPEKIFYIYCNDRITQLFCTYVIHTSKYETKYFIFSLGYAFHIASDLGSVGTFAFDRIEDAIIQADEVNGQFLQFEGGLSITSKS